MDIQPVPLPAVGTQAQAPRETSAPTSAPAQAQPAALTDEALRQAIKEIQESVGNKHTSLQFRVDEASGRIVVSVVDAETQQVVRQIPSEDVMRLARVMDRLQGLLINGKA